MSTGLEIIFNVILLCLETWMIVFASSSFFRRTCSRWLYFISAVILLLLGAYVLSLFGQFFNRHLWLKALANAAMMLLWLKIVYKESIIKCCFFIVFILTYFIVVDGLFMVFIPNIPGGIIQFALENPIAYFGLTICMKTVELFGIVVIHNIGQKRLVINDSDWRGWGRVLFFPLSTLVFSIFLSRILLLDVQFAKELAICLAVVLLIDIMSIYFLNSYETTQVAMRENAVLRQNLKLESEHITSLQENYEQQRKQTHDFYNQLAVLQGMAAKAVPQEEFSDYLGKLLATKTSDVFYINTNRTVVDIVLSQKVTLAREKGIDFQLQLDNLAQFPLPDDILVVILTNVIDNAIEACEKIPKTEVRYIRLAMKLDHQVAWLCSENKTVAPVVIRDNSVKTTKDEPMLHGYGLKNIATLLSRYNGSYTLDYREQDHLFCFYSTVPITNKV